MSRIGRKQVNIPEKVTVAIDGDMVTVKGPLGELTRKIHPLIKVEVVDNNLTTTPLSQSITANTLWGTFSSHLNNMVVGVTKGFEKKLLIEGVGFKWAVNGTNVVLNIGFSHDVTLAIPAGIKVLVEKGSMTISGFNKETVGSFASVIRGYKPVEPYKGKGIRYEGEHVLRKQGKKSSA
jgi:large subunit ribosomal protein L6